MLSQNFMLQPFLTRRRALFLSLNALGACAVTSSRSAYQPHLVKQLSGSNQSFTVNGIASLQERAAAKGLIYGSSARRVDLTASNNLATHYRQECSMIIPEWELKWVSGSSNLRPTATTFDFTDADWMVEFARSNRFLIRGHTLVWHLALPRWFRETANHQNAEQFLTQHIQTVVGRYAGRMHSWDVVNEAIEPDDGRADGLRETPWLKFLGADYIDLAFRIAAEADPAALLVYNDYGLEYDTPKHEARRTAVLKLLEQLKAKGTPIQGMGIQSHLRGHETRFNPEKFQRFLRDIASLGLKILVTELDVKDRDLPAEISVRDRIVAEAYNEYLSVVLNEPAVIAVLTWGLSDPYSWLTENAPRPDGLPVRPLPLDGDLNRKLAWNALAQCFDQCPKR